MVTNSVRAVYEKGHFRLLEPVDLTEGQEIELVIVSERERARAALAGILWQPDISTVTDEDIDEATLFAEIDADTAGKPPASDVILEERREGQ